MKVILYQNPLPADNVKNNIRQDSPNSDIMKDVLDEHEV